MRDSDIERELRIVLLCVEREQAEVARVYNPPWESPFGVFLSTTNWKGTTGYTQNSLEGLSCISYLAWECLGSNREELESAGGERGNWNIRFSLLPLRSDQRLVKETWINGGCRKGCKAIRVLQYSLCLSREAYF